MKVLHLTSSDSGGAGRAAYRLQKGLQEAGVTSQMLVQKKFTDDNNVIEPRNILWKGLYKLNLPFHFPFLPKNHSFYSYQISVIYSIIGRQVIM